MSPLASRGHIRLNTAASSTEPLRTAWNLTTPTSPPHCTRAHRSLPLRSPPPSPWSPPDLSSSSPSRRATRSVAVSVWRWGQARSPEVPSDGSRGRVWPVAAVAKLRGLDAGVVASAFGIAASMAAGSTQYLHCGSWNKRLHAGLAARNGIFAVDLAQGGVVGASEAFEGEHGVVHAYTDTPQPDQLSENLGSEWRFLSTGIKPYPSCRLTHGAIDAALEVRRQLDGAYLPSDARISVKLNPTDSTIVGGDALSKFKPANTVDGQFSVYFQVAATLRYGVPDWSVYDHLTDTEVLKLARRITAIPDDQVPHAGAVLRVESPSHPAVQVDIETASGEHGIDLPWAVIEKKFASLATEVLDNTSLGVVVEAVHGLAHGVDVADVIAALHHGASDRRLGRGDAKGGPNPCPAANRGHDQPSR